MRNYPVKRAARTPRKLESDEVEVIAPVPRTNPFFSFSYSYTEISVLGGKARVKAKKTRLEDGKLTSETFEADVDRSTYEQMVDQAQQYVLGQTAFFLKSLSSLLPFTHKQRFDRD
ncbi:MAG TPA: hypothetical protein VGK75_10045 [Casimicrobiaceae bacterium]|jgi:hypothetical protein